MKKILFSLLILFSGLTMAQTKLGLKLAPVASSNRANNINQDVEGEGSKMKVSIGLIVDKPLTETYYFSTGLVYIPKRVAFRFEDPTIEAEEYNLQYLQIPVSLKLFTNEVAPDVKVFFQVGAGLEFKVYEEKQDPNYFIVNEFNAMDLSVILGSGVEFRAGINTTLFGGFSYQRGLTNAMGESAVGYEDLQLRNTIFSIDLGVKF
jgi:hypothetical protein